LETTERIESINQRLVDLFGLDTVTGRPMWRIVWSEDQLEKRLGTYDDITREGIYLRTVTEVREVPKYRQWIHNKYVLERLVIIPDINTEELPTQKLSYEPMYVFENFKGEALPPRTDVAKIIIDSVYAAQGKKSLAKYVDDYSKFTPEAQNKRINELIEYLWDPSDISEALHQGEGIIVPGGKQ
jgi:hypothetical protein